MLEQAILDLQIIERSLGAKTSTDLANSLGIAPLPEGATHAGYGFAMCPAEQLES